MLLVKYLAEIDTEKCLVHEEFPFGNSNFTGKLA
jgi:hypothetical protein